MKLEEMKEAQMNEYGNNVIDCINKGIEILESQADLSKKGFTDQEILESVLEIATMIQRERIFQIGFKMNNFQKARLTQALLFGDRGWRVFPCRSSSYKKYKAKTPHISAWEVNATTDRDVIREWWDKWNNAAIGIATGKESGFWVLDIDTKDGDGLKSITNFFGAKELKMPEDQLFSITASGGFHLFYKWCEGDSIRNKQGILPHVDVRGEGGYIIAPPSSIKSGDKWLTYGWGVDNWKIPLREPPDWVNKLPDLQKSAKKVDVNKALIGIPKGERDTELFRLAASLRTSGVHREMVESVVVFAANRCNPPFPEEDAKVKVEQAFSYEDENKDKDFAELIYEKRMNRRMGIKDE